MRSKSNLSFVELLGSMAIGFSAFLVVAFVTSELLRLDRNQEAAARLEAGVIWRVEP